MIRRNIRNKKIKNMLSNQKGMALLTTLIFTFVIGTLAVAVLSMTSNDTKLSALQRDSTKAFYLAESGIEHTLWKLNNPDDTENGGISIPDDSDYDSDIWDTEYHEPSGNDIEYYEVKIYPVPEDVQPRTEDEKVKDWLYIDSTGVIKGNGQKVSGKRTVRVKAHLTIPQTESVLYDKAILTDQLITLQGNPGAYISGGDIHSNGGIEVKGPYVFDGTATTSGVPEDYPDTPYSDLNDLDDTEDGEFSGPENWPRIDIPEVPYDTFLTMAQAAPSSSSPAIIGTNYFPNGFDSKDYDLDEFEFTGIVYVVGDVIFRNGDSLNITDGALIVVKDDPDDPDDPTGTVQFKNGSNLTIDRTPEAELPETLPDDYYPGPIALAAQGDIELHAASSSLNGVVQSGGYYNEEGLMPGGKIEFHNSSVVTGAVVAEEVWMHNMTTINYTEDFLDDFTTITTTGDGLYQKTSWQEIYN